jgi:hypothetical protein
MSFLERLLTELPKAASHPLALVAYLAVVVAWLVLGLRVNRAKAVLDDIEKFPPQDRLKALEREMGAVTVPRDLTAEQWLRSRIHTYYFYGFIVLCAVVIVLTAIAGSHMPRIDPQARETAHHGLSGALHDMKVVLGFAVFVAQNEARHPPQKFESFLDFKGEEVLRDLQRQRPGLSPRRKLRHLYDSGSGVPFGTDRRPVDHIISDTWQRDVQWIRSTLIRYESSLEPEIRDLAEQVMNSRFSHYLEKLPLAIDRMNEIEDSNSTAFPLINSYEHGHSVNDFNDLMDRLDRLHKALTQGKSTKAQDALQ